MKRTITIYLIDGRNLQRDYFEFSKAMGVPIGAPLDHPAVVAIARAICINGCQDDANTDQNNVTWLGPAQIKSVSITEVVTLVKG